MLTVTRKTNNALITNYQPLNIAKADKKLSLISFLGKQLNYSLDEKEVLNIFEKEIVPIPRASGNCQQISNYLTDQLKKEGFDVFQQPDGVGKGNIVASRNINSGERNAIILQAHMDMVYVARKTKNPSPNVKKQIVEPIRQGDNYLMAKNTSLGADDGIGVALALAVARIKDSNFRKIPLQVIFTVDEEIGLIGVQDLPSDAIKGKYLIGLDNGNSGIIINGCAGLADFDVKEPVAYRKLNEISNKEHKKVNIKISGASGGHSGLDINKGHINPVVNIVKFLDQNKDGVQISKLIGGREVNTIPDSVNLELFVESDKVSSFIKSFEKHFKETKILHASTDPALKKEIKLDENISFQEKVLDPEMQDKILYVLSDVLKNGPITLTKDIAKPVTSQCLSSVDLQDGEIKLKLRLRSNNKADRYKELRNTQKALAQLFEKEIEPANVTPVWEQKNTNVLDLAIKAFEETNGKKPRLSSPHGTVEGSVLNALVNEQICIGPTVKDVHTPNERLYIPSLKPTCRFLEQLIRDVYNFLIMKNQDKAA
ncbi:MAG: M20/M25/M40 family metallo-hydrolase [Cyanobacteriota bacterium]